MKFYTIIKSDDMWIENNQPISNELFTLLSNLKSHFDVFNIQKIIVNQNKNNTILKTYDNNIIQTKLYLYDDKLHHDYYPASIWYYSNGNLLSERYYINGKCHRLNYPAAIFYHKNKLIKIMQFHSNNKIHKSYGPAIISYFNSGNIHSIQWYYNDNYYTHKVFEFLKNNNLNYKELTNDHYNQLWMEIL